MTLPTRTIAEVSRRTGVSKDAITRQYGRGLTGRNARRNGRDANARRVAMLTMRSAGLSYPEIARALGHSTHTAVIESVRRADDMQHRLAQEIAAVVTVPPASAPPEDLDGPAHPGFSDAAGAA